MRCLISFPHSLHLGQEPFNEMSRLVILFQLSFFITTNNRKHQLGQQLVFSVNSALSMVISHFLSQALLYTPLYIEIGVKVWSFYVFSPSCFLCISALFYCMYHSMVTCVISVENREPSYLWLNITLNMNSLTTLLRIPSHLLISAVGTGRTFQGMSRS